MRMTIHEPNYLIRQTAARADDYILAWVSSRVRWALGSSRDIKLYHVTSIAPGSTESPTTIIVPHLASGS